MLSNAYFLARFRFDTAEKEPAKNLQKKLPIFPILLTEMLPAVRGRRALRDRLAALADERAVDDEDAEGLVRLVHGPGEKRSPGSQRRMRV